jgi:hypothetical protein
MKSVFHAVLAGGTAGVLSVDERDPLKIGTLPRRNAPNDASFR